VYAHWPVEEVELSGEISSQDGRGFSPRCGSRLLDTAGLKPGDEIWVKRRESWIRPVEGAVQHDET
jgi:hypothetical protein